MQNSFVWHELLTSDPAAAKNFYGKLLGWALKDGPMPGGTYTELSAGGLPIGGIMALPAGAHFPPCWAPYVEVADVDAAAAKALQLGGSIMKPADDIPKVGRFAVIMDPQGAMLNLFKPLGASGPLPSPGLGRVGWNELHTKEAPKAWEFYQQMFGWQKSQAMDMGPMGMYQTFTANNAPTGAMFNSPAAGHGGFWMTYFGVGNIDEAGKRLTELGGKIMHGPMPVPEERWIIQASDPQGAAFAVLGTR